MMMGYSKDGKDSAVIEGKREDGKMLCCICYGRKTTRYEYHEMKYYAWVERPHGNAPGDTPYGYITASRNGKRIIFTT